VNVKIRSSSSPSPRLIRLKRLLARIPQGVTLWDVEQAFVETIILKNNGNRTHAAKELGVSVRTLRIWIYETMDINVPEPRNGRVKK